MYLILIEINNDYDNANNTVTCSLPLLFNFIRWHHASGWEQLIHATHYGLWVNLLFFMMCIYKHCFPPMLLVFAMNCCTSLALCLISTTAACFLHLYACLTCSSVHALPLHPLLAHHHLCFMLMSIAFSLLLLLLLKLNSLYCKSTSMLEFKFLSDYRLSNKTVL